jgi:pilus assembly protein CpaF
LSLEAVAQSILDHAGQNSKHWNSDKNNNSSVNEIKDAILNQEVKIQERLYAEFFEFGPLNNLIKDSDVDEILIFESRNICYEKNGRIYVLEDNFLTSSTFLNFFEDVTKSFFKAISFNNPTGNGTWESFRVHVIAPPLTAFKHISLRRKGASKIKSLNTLKELNFLSKKSFEIVMEALIKKQNLLICGATSSGKTTFIQCLINEIKEERLILIEDSEELEPPNKLSTSLCCPTRQEQYSLNFTMKDLIKESLRMRPDRIILGEARSDEAKDFIQALSTGHKGCIASIHAASARDALLRLECLISQGAQGWSSRVIKNLIFNAIDKVIFVQKNSTGLRQLHQITELCSLETDSILTEDIYNAELENKT